jgi:hypothetical protein
VFSAQIINNAKALDSAFVSLWDYTLSSIEEDCSVRVFVSVLSDETETDLLTPTISIIYRDEASGFEIYLSGFEEESAFMIPSLFVTEIIPEANTMFSRGNANKATEYILVNVMEMIYAQNRSLTPEGIYEYEQKTTISVKKLFLVGIFLSFVVFLCIFLSKKKIFGDLNYSYFFNGMSKSGFFGGDFDNMKWSYDRKKK